MFIWSLTYQVYQLSVFHRYHNNKSHTPKRHRKPAGMDMERNCVTVAISIMGYRVHTAAYITRGRLGYYWRPFVRWRRGINMTASLWRIVDSATTKYETQRPLTCTVWFSLTETRTKMLKLVASVTEPAQCPYCVKVSNLTDFSTLGWPTTYSYFMSCGRE